MLMDASPGKMLQLRRKQAIPDSYILQGVLQALGYYPFYGKQHSPCNSLKRDDSSPVDQRNLGNHSSFRNIDSLSKMLDKQEEKLRPILNGEGYITEHELAERRVQDKQ